MDLNEWVCFSSFASWHLERLSVARRHRTRARESWGRPKVKRKNYHSSSCHRNGTPFSGLLESVSRLELALCSGLYAFGVVSFKGQVLFTERMTWADTVTGWLLLFQKLVGARVTGSFYHLNLKHSVTSRRWVLGNKNLIHKQDSAADTKHIHLLYMGWFLSRAERISL